MKVSARDTLNNQERSRCRRYT